MLYIFFSSITLSLQYFFSIWLSKIIQFFFHIWTSAIQYIHKQPQFVWNIHGLWLLNWNPAAKNDMTRHQEQFSISYEIDNGVWWCFVDFNCKLAAKAIVVVLKWFVPSCNLKDITGIVLWILEHFFQNSRNPPVKGLGGVMVRTQGKHPLSKLLLLPHLLSFIL